VVDVDDLEARGSRQTVDAVRKFIFPKEPEAEKRKPEPEPTEEDRRRFERGSVELRVDAVIDEGDQEDDEDEEEPSPMPPPPPPPPPKRPKQPLTRSRSLSGALVHDVGPLEPTSEEEVRDDLQTPAFFK